MEVTPTLAVRKTCVHKSWCSFGAVIKSSELCGADLVQLFSYPLSIITLWCSLGAVNMGTNIKWCTFGASNILAKIFGCMFGVDTSFA